MTKDKKATQALEIQSLNDDVLANLSIEELEERLEMQILHLAEAQLCYDCGTYTQCNCNAQCASHTCGTNSPCTDCSTLCDFNGTCISDSGEEQPSETNF
jgi:hypothetical protein